MTSINKKSKRYETPIADFLLSNKQMLHANFHALPIYHMQPGEKGYDKYRDVFGSKYFSLETTITGKTFDSFFYPCKAIKRAQAYAADAFNANDTLFVTCGTSISNLIVVDALVNDFSHVLLDRESHQSMHFALKNKKVNYDYFYSELYCEETGRKYLNMERLLKKIRDAKNKNHPYDVIIINASSYDGSICNIYEVISKIVEIYPSTKFIVDEAWSSLFYFHPSLYKFTAGYAANKLQNCVNIVSTQSVHKSLMSLRQASLIHSFSDDEVTERLYKSRFKYHSTSPNYPILASIDMARAHMQSSGEELIERALTGAGCLKKSLKLDKNLMPYQLKVGLPSLCEISNGVNYEDPLKVHLNIGHLDFNGSELQEYLYFNYGIYFNRYTATTALVNMHIGINADHVQKLLRALKSISQMKKRNEISDIDEGDFIISYPPGIPLYAPGEKLDKRIHLEIQDRLKNGINVFQIS